MSDTESQPAAPAEVPPVVAEVPAVPESTSPAPESPPIAWEPPPPPDAATGVPAGVDDNTVYAPVPTDPNAPPVETYGDGQKTADPIRGWPVQATRPEPAFPEGIRFESGHPDDLKAWLSDWIEWKFGR